MTNGVDMLKICYNNIPILLKLYIDSNISLHGVHAEI